MSLAMFEDANSLIGTPHLPAYYASGRALGRKAKAYYSLCPYPSYSNMTRDWLTENRGPYPRCRPFVQNIINKSATWLFGKPVTFRVSDEEKDWDTLNDLINQVWTQNDMTRRARMAAVCASNSGGVVLKYSYDPENEELPIQIDVLDPTEQVYLYWSTTIIGKLLMARIQVPVWDAIKGQWKWCREEYTDSTYVKYKDVYTSDITQDTFTDPYSIVDKVDKFEKWVVETSETNDFGVIPLWYVRNRETGTEVGEGDLWSMFEIIDQINFTRDLGHKDNQKSINPSKAYIDLTAADGDQPTKDGPGAVEVLESKTDGDGSRTGKIDVFQTNAALRPHLDAFADDLKQELLSAVGSVDFRPDEITNKGNLTSAVMIQMYAPLIERTDEKRQCMGEDGICVFLERMTIGLSTIGVEGWEPAQDVQINWQPYFLETQDEKMERVQRVAMEVDNNFTTHERGVKEIASANGVIDIDELTKEVKAQKEDQEADEDVMQSAMMRQRSMMGGATSTQKSKGIGVVHGRDGKFVKTTQEG